MGIFRIQYWCVRLAPLVWLVAAAGAQELYDEPSDVDAANFPDDNLLDTGPGDQGPPLALPKDVLLYRLLQSLGYGRLRVARPSVYEEPPHFQQPLRELEEDGIVKRITQALRASGTNAVKSRKYPDRVYRPQQKWKIKKGSQMFCYFKLCAFRSPM